MKSFYKLILAAAVFASIGVNAAMKDNGSLDQRSGVDGKYSSPSDQNWQQLLMQKEGWIEGGVEILVMTSTIRSVYSDEQSIVNAILPPPPAPQIFLTKRTESSMTPDYNVGFAADLRYRAPGDNDVGAYYKYIRNNGGGSFDSDYTSLTNAPAGGTVHDQQDDSGSFHIHSHIVDVLFGRTYPLTGHFLIRLAGGMNYTDFHFHSIVHDRDDVQLFNPDGSLFLLTRFDVFANQKARFWGIGPKLGLDFEYYFLKNTWSSSLNFYLKSEFALLYCKEWTKGRLYASTFQINSLGQQTFAVQDEDWNNTPKYELIPNINLDVGLKYQYQTSGNILLNFAIGYQVLSYWNLEELNRSRFFSGGEDTFLFLLGTALDDHFMYSGAYARFSIAY